MIRPATVRPVVNHIGVHKMNEQIEKIYGEACIHYGYLDERSFCEHFAKLLIQECATIVENSKWNLPRDHKAIDQANLIKQNFGVDQ